MRVAPHAPAGKPRYGPRMKWEYKVQWLLGHDLHEGATTHLMEQQLNGLGARGWELVGISRTQEDRHLAIFKRPEPSAAQQIADPAKGPA